MTKVRIEMLVPADMDPSDLLERMGEASVEYAEEFECDEPTLGDDEDPDPEFLRNEVSVEVLPSV